MIINRKRILDIFKDEETTLKIYFHNVVICHYAYTNYGEFSLCKSNDYVNWLESNIFIINASFIDYDFKLSDKHVNLKENK